MPPNKKPIHKHGLGKALINHRSKTQKLEYQRELHTTDIYDNKPISVTQETDLENFLNTAKLADKDFTAERQNVVIINSQTGSKFENDQNPFLLSQIDQDKLKEAHQAHKNFLRVPRRPNWSPSTTPDQLSRLEKDSFLDWRKGLADLTDNRSLLLTPFERNIEVWRQLWRVVERSQLIVQIVDARNPLRFRCEDLEKYVQELSNQQSNNQTDPNSPIIYRKTNLLLINKADLLTENQRSLWAEYFDSQNIRFAFFSAARAVALQADQELEESNFQFSTDSSEDENEIALKSNPTTLQSQTHLPTPPSSSLNNSPIDLTLNDSLSIITSVPQVSSTSALPSDSQSQINQTLNTPATFDPTSSQTKTKVLTVEELENLFIEHAKTTLENSLDSQNIHHETDRQNFKMVIGLVGYPNVGKSSTINALVGSKKVSVSATPGKTKHFQTIHLSPEIILCDCPGLVFPQFASTKAELVCDGVLPIDQMREHTGPISLVTERIPTKILEATYGLQLPTSTTIKGRNQSVSATEFLTAYAIARGAFTGGGGMGRPDESKVARPILKDYVSAKLLYCEPPPLPGLTADDFNSEIREMKLKEYSQKKLAPTNRVPYSSGTYVPQLSGAPSTQQSIQSQALDRNFFENESLGPRGALKPISTVNFGIKGRRALAANLVDSEGLARLRLQHPDIHSIDETGQVKLGNFSHGKNVRHSNDKKHFKGFKKSKSKKMRSGKGYDEI
ncbi:hypothetical protein O181_043951 [Austropuccinia psidii MF-1]|uniref:CP-type G domain-containing protein n=1 Tax=Austropuccinia psidii MF-1 TaxID=1389203 RepID=A0A9Q3HGG3_9BASI|nr:hypothetical protein [Austropuccinia psidii MF-1]